MCEREEEVTCAYVGVCGRDGPWLVPFVSGMPCCGRDLFCAWWVFVRFQMEFLFFLASSRAYRSISIYRFPLYVFCTHE